MAKYYKAISVALILLPLSGHAFAVNCTSSRYWPDGFVGDIGNVNLPDDRSIPVGSPLTAWANFVSVSRRDNEVSWFCNSSSRPDFHHRGAGGAVSSYHDGSRSYSVYPTGVPGVGIVLRTFGGTRIGAFNIWAGIESGSSIRAHGRSAGSSHADNLFYVVTYRLIKTGDVSSGVVERRVIADTWWDPRTSGLNPRQYPIVLGFGDIISPNPTCDLAAGDVNRTIPLRDVQVSEFTGNSAGEIDFNLTANCRNASNVTFTFSGTADATDGTRFRNQDIGSGGARGTALWLYSRINGSNQTIEANGDPDRRRRTIAVSNNRAVLPMGAAFWKTGSVSKGRLTTPVTVTIAYN